MRLDAIARVLLLGAACAAAIACGAARSSAPPAAPIDDDSSEVPSGDPHVRIEELDRDISAALARAQVRPPVVTCSSGTCPSAMSEPFSTPAIDPACRPKPSDHCSGLCTLSASICHNQERICRIAQRLPDNWAANKCIRARASCDAAHETCCSCMQQRRGPAIPL